MPDRVDCSGHHIRPVRAAGLGSSAGGGNMYRRRASRNERRSVKALLCTQEFVITNWRHDQGGARAMTLHQTNLSTAELRAVDAAHHLHPFTDTKSLNSGRRARHRQGQGRLPVGFGRQQDHRRHVGPVERQYRPWPQGDDRRGRAADARARLLQHLLQDDPSAGHRAVARPGGDHAEAVQPGVLHRLGLGIERHHHPHGPALLGGHGQAGQDR